MENHLLKCVFLPIVDQTKSATALGTTFGPIVSMRDSVDREIGCIRALRATISIIDISNQVGSNFRKMNFFAEVKFVQMAKSNKNREIFWNQERAKGREGLF